MPLLNHSIEQPERQSGLETGVDPQGLAAADLNLPSFAILTYQEYSYQAHAESLDALLCNAFGLCGDGHG